MILITGATGLVGSYLVAELQQKQAEIAVVTRDIEAARAKFGDAVTYVKGSVNTVNEWEDFLTKVTSLFLLSAVSPALDNHEKAVIDAAARHDVQHVVKLSAWRGSPDSAVEITRLHGQAEEYLKQSGVAYTILQAQYFMQNLLGFADAIRATGLLSLPMGTASCAPIHARDIAAVAACSLLEGQPHFGQTYHLTGPDLLTFEEIAHEISNIAERPVRYQSMAGITFRSQLEGWGVDSWFANALTEVFISLAGGDAVEKTDTVRKLIGKKATSLRTFLEENQMAFI